MATVTSKPTAAVATGALAPRKPVNRVHLALLALSLGAAAFIELSWWWSRTKMRVQAAVPWNVRRRFYVRPPSHRRRR